MNRRQFIRSSISTSLLALGGISAFQFYQQSQLKYPDSTEYANNQDYVFLSPDDDILLDLLIPMIVFGSTDRKIMETLSLQNIKNNIDGSISLLSLSTQKELRDLFDLLGSAFGRLVVAGVWLNWQSAGDHSISDFLSSWRESSIELLQVGYKGLHKIVTGSSYAEENLWDSIGYPGPPAIH